MNNMQEIMSNILGAISLVGIFTGLLIEGVKRTETISTKALPVVSLFIGGLMGGVIGFGFLQDLPTYVAAGFIAGGLASGMYDSITSIWDLIKNLMGGKQ